MGMRVESRYTYHRAWTCQKHVNDECESIFSAQFSPSFAYLYFTFICICNMQQYLGFVLFCDCMNTLLKDPFLCVIGVLNHTLGEPAEGIKESSEVKIVENRGTYSLISFSALSTASEP